LKHFFPEVELSELWIQLGTVGDYGDRQWQTGKVLTGVYREDLEDVVWGYGPESSLPITWLFNSSPTPTTTHFWIADQGDDYQTPGVGWPWGGDFPNAYQKALKYINGGWKIQFLEEGSNYIKEFTYSSLIDLAKTGIVTQTGYYTVVPTDYTKLSPPLTFTLSNNLRKRFVYEILGRMIHLLQDMSVPAHVHGDGHPDMSNTFFLPCFGADWCENADEYENTLSKVFVHNRWDWADALEDGGLLINNDFLSNPLKYLFYTANQVADFFPSSLPSWPFVQYPGNNITPKGTNSIIENVYGSFNHQCPTNIDAYQIGNINYVLSIRTTASLLYWFAYEMDIIKTATFTSSVEGQAFQLRNPARSQSQNSQYYWEIAPKTVKFTDPLKVDLLGDMYSGTHAFLGWEKRDKNNVIVDGTSQLEWLDANATATSTFVANYAPWVTVSLNPIEIESASANAHYENLTTGESGSSFTFPQGYPITVKAIAPTDYLFLGWSDGYSSNPRSFNPTTNLSNIYAKFKKIGGSNDINAYKYNGQRKFIRDYSGNLFSVYSSLGKVWIEFSTNNGASWNIGNGGYPLFGGATAKNPAIELYNADLSQTKIFVTAQVNTDGYADVRVSRLMFKPYYFQEVKNESICPFEYESYSTCDFCPTIAMLGPDKIAIAFACPQTYSTLLLYYYNVGGDYQLSFYSIDCISFSDTDYFNPTLSSTRPDIEISQNPDFPCILIYESKTVHSNRKIMATKILRGTTGYYYTNPVDLSSNTGFSDNFNPSVTAWFNQDEIPSAAVSWIGYREAYSDNPLYSIGETKVVHKKFINETWQTGFNTYGTSINSVNINRNRDNSYAIAWSQGSANTNYYVKSNYLTRLNTTNTTGKYVQVGNYNTIDNMRLNSFRTNTAPYLFQLSNTFGEIQQEEEVYADRSSIIIEDSTIFYFTLGDIKVDNEIIEFIEISDTTIISNIEIMNNSLKSKPFVLTDNSEFIYGIKFGVTDSISAANSLQNNKSVVYTVKLCDYETDEEIAILDNVNFDADNILSFQNILYQVNTIGIGNKICYLKLHTEDDLQSEYSVENSYSIESVLLKEKYINKGLSLNSLITEYKMTDCFPNPFNPSTTIRYQIPKNGNVSLKIYDVLGAEITTLVNEEKVAGKYEVNFNASKLASGVYIYRIQAGDFISSKKMILLK
jgi:hypothetical protein